MLCANAHTGPGALTPPVKRCLPSAILVPMSLGPVPQVPPTTFPDGGCLPPASPVRCPRVPSWLLPSCALGVGWPRSHGQAPARGVLHGDGHQVAGGHVAPLAVHLHQAPLGAPLLVVGLQHHHGLPCLHGHLLRAPGCEGEASDHLWKAGKEGGSPCWSWESKGEGRGRTGNSEIAAQQCHGWRDWGPTEDSSLALSTLVPARGTPGKAGPPSHPLKD